ncbi:MAG: acyltransferase [Desulfovibrio sp.]|jgi:peptidoglycan/LPS O-acetylase OafA/YrhL|nr:acyltransferase [Desulfovibrio sp.]
MKSTSGAYYIGLDHVRALAALLVFSWHFLPFCAPPAQEVSPLLSLFVQGHTGVSLFMCLSGYLFAKLLDDGVINWRAFWTNRALRLLPLLLFVILVKAVLVLTGDGKISGYIKDCLKGVFQPTLPNGGWSITVEFHFYLLLPVFLVLLKRSKRLFLLLLPVFILVRLLLYLHYGTVQNLAYMTILGRVDQFALGIFAFHIQSVFVKRHIVAAATMVLFLSFHAFFHAAGGFQGDPRSEFLPPLWIVMTTIEGVAYSVLIAWYDSSFQHSAGPISRFIGLLGTYSYSNYLLHPFFVPHIGRVFSRFMYLGGMNMRILASVLAFVSMVPVTYLSYRFIESPFLKFRRRYIQRFTPAAPPVS